METIFNQRIYGNYTQLISLLKQNTTNLENLVSKTKQDISVQINDLYSKISKIQSGSVYINSYPNAVKVSCSQCGHNDVECNCRYRTGYVVCDGSKCTGML
ncbi:Hypothetical_protein [Hexamita inflata]|uniref:Hypothetical_protein n=1 Tax=Hexamita inflata TaxID=28002 RepID=A0AA86V5A7_9EUKA|nr:Hypothetical protein HINF_LOCUS64442 [Hexamita inflata]